MKDMELIEKCPKCGENLTLMTSINTENWNTYLVKRCLTNACIGAVEVCRMENITALEQSKGWTSVDDELPTEKGKYLVTYHPCYWDTVREQVLVGTDTFRGKKIWAKYKYQRNTHWMKIPEAAIKS